MTQNDEIKHLRKRVKELEARVAPIELSAEDRHRIDHLSKLLAHAATDPAPTTRELKLPAINNTLSAWYAKLAPGPRNILYSLVRAYPEPMARGRVAEIAGTLATSPEFKRNLATLLDNQLITVSGGAMRASANLFSYEEATNGNATN